MAQRTSLVKDGVARQIGRMVEDAARIYSGGTPKAELAKGHPDFVERFHGLLDELADERAQTLAVTERPNWKTIQIGRQKSVQELRQELEGNGFKIGTWSGDILDKTTVAPKPAEVNLVLITVADLGFPNGATREQIYKKALNLGLSICPAEVGPQLRLQYKDQPKGEWVLVAMEPIADSDRSLEVFDVRHDDDGLCLDGLDGNPDDFWGGSNRWVFCRE